MTNAEPQNSGLPQGDLSTEFSCEPIRVLLLTNSAGSPIRALLASIPLVHICSPAIEGGVLTLARQAFDVAMIDLPIAVDSQASVENLHGADPALPIIVLADRDDEDAALELLRCGASDYLLTEDLDLDCAARALRYALNLSRLRRRVQDLNHYLELANYRLRELFLPATERLGQKERIANCKVSSADSLSAHIVPLSSPDRLAGVPITTDR